MNASVLEQFDPSAIRFAEPAWLPMLIVPVVLLVLWMWQLWKRVSDRREFGRGRRAAIPVRIPIFGDLLFWFCLLLALAGTIVALARPVGVRSLVRTAGVDLIILQDGSASMRVKDVRHDRWQRSMRFVRMLGESLRWERDRVALALFAGIATPQIRLTRDPNTLFFFLDHLETEPPFRLQDAGTWDTNIERGIYWGLRLIDKDEEIRGPSPNGRAFVLLSDGQAWSGEVERSIAMARERNIPIHVVGVGTTAGGVIPDAVRASGTPLLDLVLDRGSLSTIATAGGGRCFELDRDSDRDIANTIIATTRARAPGSAMIEDSEDLYHLSLLIAAGMVVAGVLLQRDRGALGLQLAAAALMLGVAATLFA